MLADGKVEWFDSPVGEGYQYLTSYIDNILQANSRRYTDYVRYAALYGDAEQANMINMFSSMTGSGSARGFRRLSFNVCSSAVDTVTNQRASEAPDIIGVSQGGNYREFREAIMLTQGVKAELKKNQHDMQFARVVQNALVFGRGYQTVERMTGKLNVQRIFTPEMVFDPYDTSVDRWPHTIAHVRYVNRNLLKSQYPEHADAIDRACSETQNYVRVRGEDNVRVDEAWTCAVGSKKGKHLCSITGCDLVELEDYEYETPPFVSLPWGLPFQGFYAPGLISQLMGLQLEINDTLSIISEACSLFGNPFMLIEKSAGVETAQISDIAGKILKYTNIAPQVVAPHIVPPELFQHLQTCYQKAYEISGISMYDAGTKTLPRFESSKAMRMASQNSGVRHFNFGAACERYHTELAHLICREAAILGEEEDYKTRMPRSSYFKEIPWKDIAYSVEKFAIEIDTVNKQNNSAAGQIQDVEDMAQVQQLTLSELRRYLLNPDIKRVLFHITASDEYTDWVVHKLTYDEQWIEPEEFMDLQTAFKVCIAEYLNALRLEASDIAIANLHKYILALKTLIDDAAQEQANMVAMAQAQAQAKMGAPAQAQLPMGQGPSQQ